MVHQIETFMTRRRILVVAALYTTLAYAGIFIAIRGLLP